MRGRALAISPASTKYSCGEESNLHGLLFATPSLAAAMACPVCPRENWCKRHRRELRGRSIGILGRQILGRALPENSHGVRETAFERGQVAETGCGEDSPKCIDLR